MTGRGRPRKISNETLLNIQRMAKEGKGYLAIAKELGENPGSVKYWLKKGIK